LDHAGAISRDEALEKAQREYEVFRKAKLAKPTEAEKHSLEAEAELKQIESDRKWGGK
jgi:hypothetical protein